MRPRAPIHSLLLVFPLLGAKASVAGWEEFLDNPKALGSHARRHGPPLGVLDNDAYARLGQVFKAITDREGALTLFGPQGLEIRYHRRTDVFGHFRYGKLITLYSHQPPKKLPFRTGMDRFAHLVIRHGIADPSMREAWFDKFQAEPVHWSRIPFQEIFILDSTHLDTGAWERELAQRRATASGKAGVFTAHWGVAEYVGPALGAPEFPSSGVAFAAAEYAKPLKFGKWGTSSRIVDQFTRLTNAQVKTLGHFLRMGP